MDKFDTSIKDAQKKYEPKTNFVEATMSEITNQKPKTFWNRLHLKVVAPALAGSAAIIVVAFIAWPKPAPKADVTNTVNKSGTSATASPVPASSIAPISAGSDDNSLQGDINSAQSSINQSGSDQSSADNAVNDSSQEITVPTS